MTEGKFIKIYPVDSYANPGIVNVNLKVELGCFLDVGC
jgi:hypothetical protein